MRSMDVILGVWKELSGAPAEFQVLPEGKIEITGEEPAWIDEAAARQVIACYKARGNDMVIDYEHQSLDGGQAPAAGWVRDLVWKGKEGLWAVVEWTQRAKDYLENREYRYFSPVMYLRARDRMVQVLVNIALTNTPAINNLKPIVAKMRQEDFENGKKEEDMIKKLATLLGLAADTAEDKVYEAAELTVNKLKTLEGSAAVACREVLDALGADENADKDEVIRIVAAMKAPADVAQKLSLQVAELQKQIGEMRQTDLIELALKDGKTSPAELDDWGRELAKTSPEQFRKIVLSRPAGSVVPVQGIHLGKETPAGGVPDDVQLSVNKQMGLDDETFKKYNS